MYKPCSLGWVLMTDMATILDSITVEGNNSNNNNSYLFNARFPRGLSGKDSSCQCRRQRRLGFDPWVWKIHWRRKWKLNPVYLLGKSQDRGDWWAIVHRVAKSRIQLGDWTGSYSVPGPGLRAKITTTAGVSSTVTLVFLIRVLRPRG